MSTLERKFEEAVLTDESYVKATKDLGVCLMSISKTLRKVAGASLGALGTTAGRIAASHLPHMFEEEKMSFEELLKDLQERWKYGFKFDYILSGTSATLTFDHCPILAIISKGGEKIGGDTCFLFHSYLQGILVEVLEQRVQVKPESMGEKCVLKVTILPKFDD